MEQVGYRGPGGDQIDYICKVFGGTKHSKTFTVGIMLV